MFSAISVCSLRWPKFVPFSAFHFSSFSLLSFLRSSFLLSPLFCFLLFRVRFLSFFYVVFSGFICRQFAAGGRLRSYRNLSGQTGVVTGAGTGIGWYTARQLSEMGMDVWIGVRGEERATRVAKAIEEEAAKELEKERGKRKQGGDEEGLKKLPKSAGKVFGRDLDLSSVASIKRFASSVATHQDKIDLLVNNAGVMASPYALTADGFENQIGTNHLGHFYLTQLLLPKLIKAGKSRIVNVSSAAIFLSGGSVDYESQFNPASYDPWKAYGMSKLLNIYFTRALHQRYHSLGVTSTAVHPGSVNTELTRHSVSTFVRRIGYPILFCLFKVPQEGAQTNLHCSVAPDVVSGEFYCDAQQVQLGGFPTDVKAADEWWTRSEKMLKDAVEKIENKQ